MASVTEFQIIVENFQGGTLKVGWILDGDVYVRFRVVCDGQFVFDYEATTEPIHVHELSETDVKIALGNFASYYRKVLPRAFTNFVPELEKLIERHFTTPLHEGFEL